MRSETIQETTTLLSIDSIRRDGGTQVRTQLSHEHVAHLTEALRAGATLPAVTVFYDGTTYWLADGFHRVSAHRNADHEEIICDVRRGTQRDAILFACSANATHGLPRTTADKRNAVRALAGDSEWSKWGSREIAQRCCVSRSFAERQMELSFSGAPLDLAPPKPARATGEPEHISFAKASQPTVTESVAGHVAKMPPLICALCNEAPRRRHTLCWSCYRKLREAGVDVADGFSIEHRGSYVALGRALIGVLGPTERAELMLDALASLGPADRARVHAASAPVTT